MNREGFPLLPEPGWEHPGARRRWSWSALLWDLVFPAQTQRVRPTLSGLVLIALALGIGSAAYNAANNILFVTLALLLACLILSGVMSWANLRGVRWQLQVAAPLRAGQPKPVTVELRNGKRLLPTYGLWFDLEARAVPAGRARPETTFRATGSEIRSAFARRGTDASGATLALRERLDPGCQTQLDWLFTPARRGRIRVRLASVGSLFPFGFLRKNQRTGLSREALVWPAPVEYRLTPAAAPGRRGDRGRVSRTGAGDDLLSVRRYRPGDSHRLVHWKASARLRELMVRQLAAESAGSFFVWVQTPAGAWTRPEQFELLCGFAATLAEDFAAAGRLTGAAINDGEAIPVRRRGDVERFLDALAELEAETGTAATGLGPAARSGAPGERNGGSVVTFAPDGARGVVAYIHGIAAATA